MIRGVLAGTEKQRLDENHQGDKDWKKWGPYLSDRQWGTVREDYSPDGCNWTYFTHDHARSRVYRWGEDGLLGITDRECLLCFAVAMWNGKDPILKERPFGLSPDQANHGEDVKEDFFFIDSTPTHSYMKLLYKYPQREYPYQWLIEENKRVGKEGPEFELLDTGIFNEGRYFDVFAEYAKSGPEDICIRLSIANRGPEPATLHFLPTLWFRNTWIFGVPYENWPRPVIRRRDQNSLLAEHAKLGRYVLVADNAAGGPPPELLFTENETNNQRIFGTPNSTSCVKDAFHDYVIHGRSDAVNREAIGTKAAFYYRLDIPARQTVVLRLRLLAEDQAAGVDLLGQGWQQTFDRRFDEANRFYNDLIPQELPANQREIIRQAYSGLLLGKQFYYYVIDEWLNGDPKQPPPPEQRKDGRNHTWKDYFSRDVVSTPDKWEYPMFVSWDLACQALPLARVDPYFAKEQLLLQASPRMMKMDGQLPSMEYNFNEIMPPIHAWSCLRLYQHDSSVAAGDLEFLKRSFEQMELYWSWWVNRKDIEHRQVFAGGVLGMDNLGVFQKAERLPGVEAIESSDATAFVAFFCLGMMRIAMELAPHEPYYEDTAARFFQYFLRIADAANTLGGTGLWDEQDGFYYNIAQMDDTQRQLKIRSVAGLIPLLATVVLDDRNLGRCPALQARINWLLTYRAGMTHRVISVAGQRDAPGRLLLSMVQQDRLRRLLQYMLDENEFLSPYGIRSLSRYHREHPCTLWASGRKSIVDYEPGMSRTTQTGVNSNWRGPIWMPVNYLLVEALDRYHEFFGDDFRMECPTGSGKVMNLHQIAQELRLRLCRIFLPDRDDGHCPWHGPFTQFSRDPYWNYLILFHEYFHAETGMGLGASHQTGWTALIIPLLEQAAEIAAAQQATPTANLHLEPT